MTNTKRYYAFDALRATMMFLGIVIHSSMSYNHSADMAWPLRAKETSVVFHFLVDFIHAFRMPVFFVISGFFGALLFYDKSPEQMLRNRFKRIFLPFLVFLVALNPFIVYSFRFCRAVFEEELPPTLIGHFSSFWSYVPFGLYHLWFLYYLFLISCLVYLIAKLSQRIAAVTSDKLFGLIFKNPVYRLLALSSISFIVLVLFNSKSFETSISWIPDLGILMYFLVFYLTGWLLYRSNELVSTLKQLDLVTTTIGVLAFCIKFLLENQMNLVTLQLTNSLISSALTIGLIGLFLRFADLPNKYVAYLVNSAYWVYLIHFSIAVLLTALIDHLSVSVYLKSFIVLTTTATICLITYHFFIRNTFIGLFLNGKKTK